MISKIIDKRHKTIYNRDINYKERAMSWWDKFTGKSQDKKPEKVNSLSNFQKTEKDFGCKTATADAGLNAGS